MKTRPLRKDKRAARAEWIIQQEIARVERIMDENERAMRVLSRQLDNEPRALKQAFAEIEKLTTAEAGKEIRQ